jgi:hypothetical protein
MPQLTSDTLLNLGFRDIAAWVASSDNGGIDYFVDGPNAPAVRVLLDQKNSLYAFVHGDRVMYIGKTARTLRERLAGYRNPHKGQRTNWRCNGNIREMLKRNEVLRILAFNPISHLRYGGFDINLAAALEDSLIAEFKPPWSGRERGHAITEEAERELVEEAALPIGTASGAPTALPIAPEPESPIPVGVASFQITLAETCYRQGLINPGVDASRYLGDDGDPIAISFGDGSEPVTSHIDRTANKSGAVRVVGRNRLIAQWFQKHFSEGDIVEARILDRHHILLLPNERRSDGAATTR